jgi:glycosyltransferase involved in cell wall biosynthesis
VKIALVSGNPHLPQLVGGVEVNSHELAHGLIAAGHEPCVVAKLSPRDGFGAARLAKAWLTGRNVQVDDHLGYPVYRSFEPWNTVRELPRVDVALVQNGSVFDFHDAFRGVDTPSVPYFLGLPFEQWDRRYAADPAALPFRSYVAVSEYVATRFHRMYGLASLVVPPITRREKYSTDVIGREVTFINPVPEKGVELALRIAARCPEITFGFVLGWKQSVAQLCRLRRALTRLPNVRLRARTHDMRAVYRRTKILLVPSQWDGETWGRVASEAQFSGIPVVASDRGGLPEAVGPGGVIIGHDADVATWAETLRTLWSDAALYLRLSAEAARHASRSLLDPAAQTRALLGTLQRAIR